MRQIISAMIPDTAFNHVKGCTNAKDTWTVLKKIYEERTCSLMADMMRCLRNKRCGDSDNLRTHFEQLSDLHEQLAAMGKIIADNNYTDLLMSLLPPCYDLALKSGCFQGYWSTDIPKMELRDVRLQFLVVTTDFDDEEMPKPAGKGLNDEEEVKEVVFPRYD